MTERLTIHRDWTPDHTDTKYFTLEELESLRHKLSMTEEEFSEFITGLHCDSYADLSCDIMSDFYQDNRTLTPEEVVEQCMSDPEFQTCYTVFRLWNTQHSQEVAMSEWKDSCVCTLEGLLECEVI